MGYLCIQVVGLLFIVASEAATTIHLFPAGIVSEATIKGNLINAYNRFLRGKKISFYLNGEKLIDQSTVTTDQINALNLSQSPPLSCSHWYMNQLEDDADNYILTDHNPCNGTQTVQEARQFLARNRFKKGSSIVPIGMGNQINSQWLKQTCGPCTPPLGCVRGWNWFRL